MSRQKSRQQGSRRSPRPLASNIVEGESSRIEQQRDVLRLACRKLHTRETLQLFRWARHSWFGFTNSPHSSLRVPAPAQTPEYTQPELEAVSELYACSASFSISILFIGAKSVFRRPLQQENATAKHFSTLSKDQRAGRHNSPRGFAMLPANW